MYSGRLNILRDFCRTVSATFLFCMQPRDNDDWLTTATYQEDIVCLMTFES